MVEPGDEEPSLVRPDPAGQERALRRAAMPASLLIPIAAVDKEAIQRHVGRSVLPVPGTRRDNAFQVVAECGPSPSDLAVWQHKRAAIINMKTQIWVDIGYSGYRRAYRTVFHREDVRNMVIHHIMNRRYARLHGFRYVRLVPISRSTNSSCAFSEDWGVTLTRDEVLRSRVGEASVSYADLADLMSMLDMPAGGGVMDNVRQAAALLNPIQTSDSRNL